MAIDREDKLAGVLLGTAVGDALGLPREGLSRRRARRLFGDGSLRHGLLLGRGMVSDDTEHACMTGQALLARADDASRFARSLAWRLRFWLLGFPAGIGFGTLRAILKLWLGFPPSLSGVRSAGNGPAMRAPVIGAAFSRDREKLKAHVSACTRLTHRDPRAEQGALAVAICAAHAEDAAPGQVDAGAVIADLRANTTDPEFGKLLDGISENLASSSTVEQYADSLGLQKGVTGYIYHTVPVVIFAWLRHATSRLGGNGFKHVVEEVIWLGGDADTTGAIAGALAGATVGESGIPGEWLAGVREWPRSVSWMRRLSERLARRFPADGQGERGRPLRLFWPAIPMRNLLFLIVVLLHGFRRLLPPY